MINKINIKEMINPRGISLLLVLMLGMNVFGQTKPDSGKIIHSTFNDFKDLRKQIKEHKIVSTLMVDSLLGYQAIIPDWLKLRETGSLYMLGGMLPPVNGVVNAILIKAFPKKRFTSIDDFKDYVIGYWVFGTHPKWGNEHFCYGLKEMDSIPSLGRSFRASNRFENNIYTCNYVLVETKTAYLWIDFTATPDTYPINLEKFNEFLKGLKIL